MARSTVLRLTPTSSAILRFDFSGSAAFAWIARWNAGIAGAPQLHDASMPQEKPAIAS
jgi:hypothetical protein